MKASLFPFFVLIVNLERLVEVDAMSFSRGLVETSLGNVHFTKTGSLESGQVPCLAFHMSPRSTDEYREAMPLLSGEEGEGRMIVAIDELGYGQSDNPCRSCTLDEIADVALTVADSLGIDKFVALGSLLGCCFAVSLAARHSDRVKALVLTNPYHYPKPIKVSENDSEEKDEASLDPWVLKEDGSHLSDLWSRRSGWLDPELNTRAVMDEMVYLLKKRERYANGVFIQDVSKYDFEGASRRVICPVLLLPGAGATLFFDAIGFNMSVQFALAVDFFSDSEVAQPIHPGSINMINQDAVQWAKEVKDFLASKSL